MLAERVVVSDRPSLASPVWPAFRDNNLQLSDAKPNLIAQWSPTELACPPNVFERVALRGSGAMSTETTSEQSASATE